MRIAIVAAKFTPAEADRLRRAMATFKRVGTIDTFRKKFIDGMTARGYQRDFAERCFSQIEGFGEYGFPESHAASFANLVYASAWIKCHLSGCVRGGAAQQPADGLLCDRADRARRSGARRRGAAGRHQFLRLGLHAGTRRGGVRATASAARGHDATTSAPPARCGSACAKISGLVGRAWPQDRDSARGGV